MKTGTALCAAISIGETGDEAPEWLHLLPAGEAITRDGRGPYRVADAAALMSASMAGGKLTLCENHATDLAAPKGEPAPAHGWIVELQNRADGIWGKVDWVDPAQRIWRRYRGVSPVITHDKSGTVGAILRATLTNTPNLSGLRALHSEDNGMDFRAWLIEALGLDAGADDDAIAAAAKAKMTAADDAGKAALQSALKPIALAAGVAEDADAAAVLAGVEQLKGGGDVTALQSQVTSLQSELKTERETRQRDKATAFVDAAIGAGRVGLKPVRAEYIAMHMEDPAKAERLINAMPVLAPGRTQLVGAVVEEGATDSPALLAQKAGAYQAKLAAAGQTIDFAAAVRAVQGGKTA